MDTLFFIAAKLGWALIRPETLLVFLVALGLYALHRLRLGLAKLCLTLGLAGLLGVAVFPLGDVVLGPLEARYPANPDLGDVAGILVLGGGEEELVSAAKGQPTTNNEADRFLAAIALAERFPNAPLIFTGGSARVRGGPSGALIAEEIFIDAGIAPERLGLESASRNTAENATFSRDLIIDYGEGSWLLVTSAFHMPRAVGSFCAAGWQNIRPWPAGFRSGAFRQRIGWDLARNLDDLNTGVKEWIGLMAYWVSGRVLSPEAAPGCLVEED
ncbi:YdcF family protein [Rhodovulum sp. YNF3179]|uniref:YdcF family protein n=1 Tax=Rhodovulum sp. YNF3179 TaxID=3425127 RepID=UPI003D335FC1